MRQLFRFSILTAIFAIAIVSCKSDKETVIKVGNVTITVSGMVNNTVTVGDKLTVTATVTPADATDKGVTLTSSDNSVISVTTTANGWTIEALKAGTATLTATANDGSGKKFEVSITVIPKEVTLVSIAVSGTPTKTVYEIGEPFNPAGITVTATYSDNSTAAVPLTEVVFAADFSATAGTNKSVKVSFTYKGITRETTITGITVNEPVPTLVSVAVNL